MYACSFKRYHWHNNTPRRRLGTPELRVEGDMKRGLLLPPILLGCHYELRDIKFVVVVGAYAHVTLDTSLCIPFSLLSFFIIFIFLLVLCSSCMYR